MSTRTTAATAALALALALPACSSPPSDEGDGGSAADAEVPAFEPGDRVEASPPEEGAGADLWQTEDWPEDADLVELHLVDTGGGSCVLVELPNGKKILFDCGGGEEADAARVRGYLEWALPARHLDTLVVRRPEPGHYDLLPYAVRGFNVDEVLLAASLEEHSAETHVDSASGKASGGLQGWLEDLQGGKQVRVLSSDDVGAHGENSELFHSGATEFYVLAAGEGELGLMLTYGGFDVALAGGTSASRRGEIAERYPARWLDVEVLEASAAGGALAGGWLDALRPEATVASGGLAAGDREALAGHAADFGTDHPVVWGGSEESTSAALFTTGPGGGVVVQADGSRVRVWQWSRDG